jgi:hypothetical protein
MIQNRRFSGQHCCQSFGRTLEIWDQDLDRDLIADFPDRPDCCGEMSSATIRKIIASY